jgi:aryl sulfotransferase
MYNLHKSAPDAWYEARNERPWLIGPKIGKPIDYYHEWLDKDGFPFHSFWDNVGSCWEIKDLPNAMLLHFNDLKKDMPGEISKIAAFLDIPIDESTWEDILLHCSFDYMKKNAVATIPNKGASFKGGVKAFINKGTNGTWKDILSQEESKKYEKMAVDKLGPACAHWLSTGEF